MSQDFTTRLQLQLREAALREERRGPLGRWLAGARLGMPGPAASAAVGLAALLLAVVVVAGGLRWGAEDDAVSNPKVIGTVPLADNLGTISAGFGSVWVADTSRQVLLRVDPESRRVQAEIPTGGDRNALGGDPAVNTGAGAVWALVRNPGADGGHEVLRIDPRTNRITSRAELPARQAPLAFDVQVIGERPWVITARGAIELDPQTAEPRRFVKVDLPSGEPYPQWTIAAESGLWVLTRAQRIDRYDLETGRRTSSLPVRLPGARGIVPVRGSLLLAGLGGDLARAGATDGRIAWRQRVGDTSTVPLIMGETIWIHASDVAAGRDRLVQMDLATGRVRSSTPLPELGIAGIAPVGRDIWITTPAGDVMIVRT